jgi:hypothetical protein
MEALHWTLTKLDLLATTALRQLAATLGGGAGLLLLFAAVHWITGGSFTQAVLSAPATPTVVFFAAFLGAVLAASGKDRS